MIIVGIDPDSKKHGVAIYNDGKLTALHMNNNQELVVKLINSPYRNQELLFSIEDVCANNFIYARNNKENKLVVSKIALSIGRCQQAQKELMMWLDFYNIKYVLHKPQKGNWAKNKSQFEKVTGWTGRSNEDTRSGAFMGWLALKNKAVL